MSGARRRPTQGDYVQLADTVHSEEEAAGGCLAHGCDPAEVGWVTEDQHDEQPFQVRGPRGDEYWYREDEVALATSPPQPAAAAGASPAAAQPVAPQKEAAGMPHDDLAERVAALEDELRRKDGVIASLTGGRPRRSRSASARRGRPQRYAGSGAGTPRGRHGAPRDAYHFFSADDGRVGSPRGALRATAPHGAAGGSSGRTAYSLASPRAVRRRPHPDKHASTLAHTQGWNWDPVPNGKSANEMRGRMKAHQHCSPRPERRVLADEEGCSQAASRKVLEAQKKMHSRGFGGAATEATRTPPPGASAKARARGGADRAPQPTWPPATQREELLRQRRNAGMMDGNHAKLVVEDSRNAAGLHTSWAELQRYKRHHSSDMRAGDQWHGDGRMLGNPGPQSGQWMRRQMRSHAAPERPHDDCKLSPQRNREQSRVGGGQQHRVAYSCEAMREAKRTGQHAIAPQEPIDPGLRLGGGGVKASV